MYPETGMVSGSLNADWGLGLAFTVQVGFRC